MLCYDNRLYWTRLHAARQGSVSTVGYAAFGEGFNRAAYVLRRRALLRLLGRNPSLSPRDLLEAASGVGAYAPVWRRIRVRRWTGLDIASGAVEHCRRAFPEGRFLELDLAGEWSDVGLAGESFDLVTAIDVLYHLTDDAAFENALSNLARCVRRGGALVVSDVFVARDKQIAPHVKRRSLTAYSGVLGSEWALTDREPVFSILADPVPDRRCLLSGMILLTGWRLIARAALYAPPAARDAAGAAAVWLAWPLDAAFRRLGFAAGTNLELAVFTRR
jgi:SAM-dependent methyltransferase